MSVQQACLAMEDAELEDIEDNLKANEAALIAGQDSVQSACDGVCNVESVV